MSTYINCCPVTLTVEEFKRVRSGEQTEIYKPMITNWRKKLVGKSYDYMICSCGEDVKYLAEFKSTSARCEAAHPEWGEKSTEKPHFVIVLKGEGS